MPMTGGGMSSAADDTAPTMPTASDDDTGMASATGPVSTTVDEPTQMPTGMPGGMGTSVQPTDEPVAPLPGGQSTSGAMGSPMGGEPTEEVPETTVKEPEEDTGPGVPPKGGMMGGAI
ncbi:MAG: hypothetical protein UT19_C0001G0037 [Candidatus Woesebacteria bacterium GW2011_GWB1_39_10b]|nr:MAG: hypothetical protein US72_C0003G0080 [Microgenomates group bacterium GW2011_GWC1_38_12]KKQ94505.1 MAG: hypothetical protein UT19_C0001G0037 [Candidatus Woesebacteria bacterium GW2011_GWB1_39_10b]KKR13902.1 MAG: hypothetical protein UT40_C0008G0026 [Candidatus Woesebacteria bacterium GW2011_GWA1_39_21b]